MRAQQLFIFFLSVLLGVGGAVALLSSAYAKEGNQTKLGNVRVELEAVQESPEAEDESETDDQKSWMKTKISDKEFEMSGIMSGLSGNANTFVVNNKTVVIDYSKVAEYKQKGILVNGNKVKVSGVVNGTSYYATEINVIGTGQGRFKVEYKGAVSPTASPTPTVSPSPTVSASPTPSASPTASPDAEESASPSPSPTTEAGDSDEEFRTLLQDLGVIIKMTGPAEKVAAFMEQISTFFKGLLNN